MERGYWICIEIFEAHDKIYDRYVTQWRRQYDRDVIIPRLLAPFLARLGDAFYEYVDVNRAKAMEALYYPYVMDGQSGRIPDNLRVRFYERVTKYWLSIVNEMVTLVLVSLIGALRFVGPSTSEYRTMLLNALCLLILFFVLNRLWARATIRSVRIATIAQIAAIHAQHHADLETRLVGFCSTYGIPISTPS
jgi:hypothetical protein